MRIIQVGLLVLGLAFAYLGFREEVSYAKAASVISLLAALTAVFVAKAKKKLPFFVAGSHKLHAPEGFGWTAKIEDGDKALVANFEIINQGAPAADVEVIDGDRFQFRPTRFNLGTGERITLSFYPVPKAQVAVPFALKYHSPEGEGVFRFVYLSGPARIERRG